MPSTLASAPFAPLDAARRDHLLERFTALRSGREKPGRFWRIDLETIAAPQAAPYSAPAIKAPAIRGGFVTDIMSAARDRAELFASAFGHAVKADEQKYAALAAALCNTGAFIYIPAGVSVDDPIEISYQAGADGALFPYTLVLAEAGSRCTVIEHVRGDAGAFVCGISEIACAESAQVVYASAQDLPQDATVLYTRAAAPGKNAQVTWSVAHLGAHLAVDSLDVLITQPGVDAQTNALFFPGGTQHVDLTSTASHDAGESQSQTLIKSAATGSGQGRYLGNIRIAPHAQGTQAGLRDDALLLSKRAHIDSVPALEIAANDVKAFHGATVGALDEEAIFYMTSRGIARADAERMIALGFFEPVVERFPSVLRDEIRTALQAKISS